MIIEARELSKIYGSGESRVVALDKADLKIGQGDFLSITGPSGSGKSTLLHLLSGLDRPTSGLLSYGGRDIYSFHDKELSAFRRRRIGFIFQQFNLLPVLTARENIIMPLLLDKKQPDEAYLRKLTELLGIQKRLNHLPHELSGGQQQRVAIARALAAQPDIIFADEPTGNLDSKSGGEVMELLCNIRRELDKTLVVITHDSRIAKMADRQFVIVDGILSETAGWKYEVLQNFGMEGAVCTEGYFHINTDCGGSLYSHNNRNRPVAWDSECDEGAAGSRPCREKVWLFRAAFRRAACRSEIRFPFFLCRSGH